MGWVNFCEKLDGFVFRWMANEVGGALCRRFSSQTFVVVYRGVDSYRGFLVLLGSCQCLGAVPLLRMTA